MICPRCSRSYKVDAQTLEILAAHEYAFFCQDGTQLTSPIRIVRTPDQITAIKRRRQLMLAANAQGPRVAAADRDAETQERWRALYFGPKEH